MSLKELKEKIRVFFNSNSHKESWANMITKSRLFFLAILIKFADSTFQELRINIETQKYENVLIYIDPDLGWFILSKS